MSLNVGGLMQPIPQIERTGRLTGSAVLLVLFDKQEATVDANLRRHNVPFRPTTQKTG